MKRATKKSSNKKTEEPALSTTGRRLCILRQSLSSEVYYYLFDDRRRMWATSPRCTFPLISDNPPKEQKSPSLAPTRTDTFGVCSQWRTHRYTWPRNPKDTTGHGRIREGKRCRRLGEATTSVPFFIIFTVWTRGDFIFPRLSVRWKYTVSSDDNATANLFVVFALVGKLENFHDIVFLR